MRTCNKCGRRRRMTSFPLVTKAGTYRRRSCVDCWPLRFGGAEIPCELCKIVKKSSCFTGERGAQGGYICVACCQIHKRDGYMLRQRYGIALAQYKEMVRLQTGRCLICHKRPDKLVVDHNHQTGVEEAWERGHREAEEADEEKGRLVARAKIR